MFKTIKDYNDNLIKQFREKIDKFETDESYRYWFTEEKMSKINWVNFECFLVDKELVAISGCSLYNDSLRVLQSFYLLPNYRHIRYLPDINGGFFDRHEVTAKELGINKLFFSIHVHNKKTEQLANVWKNRKKENKWRNKFVYIGEHIVRYVPQECFECNLS